MKADQLSQTAAFVAIKFYGLTQLRSFRSFFDDDIVSFYAKLVKSLPAPLCYYHFWLKFRWIRKLYIWSEELLLPGDLLHIVMRKWYIQQMTQQLIEEGYEQIVVLGAGFDHLAHYFSNRGISCFEFDTPHMAHRKRNFFQQQYPKHAHPEIIDLHLPNDHLRTLFGDEQELKSHQKTIIIAEGFFDYLKDNTVIQCLNNISTYFSKHPALLSTHFALNELSPFHQRVFRSSVKMVGEKLEFNTSMNQFSKIISENGFQINQLYDSESISTILKTDLPVLKGFYVFSAKYDMKNKQKPN